MTDPSPRQPRFLTPPPPDTLSNSPELRKLALFGGFFGLLLIATLVMKFLIGNSSPPPTQSSQTPSPTPTTTPDSGAPPPTPDATPDVGQAPTPVETTEERQRRVKSMFGGALERMTDGADFDQSVAYLDVVEEVAKSDLKLFHRRASPTFEWDQAMNQPATVRGNYYRLHGVIDGLKPVKLFHPAGDVEDVYRFVMLLNGSDDPCVVDLVTRPTAHIEERADLVDVDAVFLRTVKFESKQNKFVEIPYLIGRTVQVYRAYSVPPNTLLQGNSRWVVLGVVVVAAMVVARMLLRANPQPPRRGDPALRKPGVGIRELFEMRLREDEAARKRDAPPPSPPEPKQP
jgi:hypothetical protein